MKKCSKCQVLKPLGEFYRDRGKRDGKRSQCATCCSSYRRTETGKAATARGHVRYSRTEKRKAATSRYSKTGKGKAAKARYCKKYPEKNAAREARREAQKIQATPAWVDPAAIARVYEDAHDLTELTYREWHVDHIVPLRHKLVCGLHVEHNLRPLEGIENARKGNRHWPDMPT